MVTGCMNRGIVTGTDIFIMRNIWSHFFLIIMPHFEEEEVYCFANVGRSVDQIVSADYLKYHLSQSLHISDWS